MKKLLNILNRTANAVKISGGGSSHVLKYLFTIVTLLLTFGVGNAWANYAYLDLSVFTQWYEKGENGTVDPDFTVSISSDHCNKVQVNGNSGVWRFSIGDESGTAYFKRRHKDQCNGKWNECSGTVNASQNVMHVTGWDNSGEMRTAFVINYIHNTNQIYFDNTNSNFSGNIYFVIGHDVNPNGTANTYSIAYLMSPVIGTNLYRAVISATWEDANFYGIIASTSDESTVNGDHKWGSSSLSSKGTSGYTAAYKYVFNMEGGVYLCSTSASGNNQALTFSYCGTEHTFLPKHNASQAAKKRDTGTTYTDVSGSWPATLKLRGSYMKTSSDTARSTITSTASTDGDGNKTYSAIQSGLITQSYTGLDANYYFEGWGTESTPTNKETTNEYHISENTTVYAFFSKLYTLTYDRKGDYSTSTVTCYSVVDYSGAKTSGSSIPTGHLITIVATPATGYEVKGWYSDASCTSAYTNGDGGVTIESGNNTFKLESLDANTGVYPKFGPKTYTINLVGMEATTPGTTSVDVTYNASTHMTASDPIAKPTKNGYTFGGYWTSENTGATLDHQLIDADGKWIADVSGYTSYDGDDPTWVHDYAISLYAKWTEIKHTVNVAVSPAGAGSVQVNSSNVSSVTNVGISTKSAEMTPIALPGWKFKEWQATSNVQMDLVNYHSDYQQGSDNKMKINATADAQTLTAVFEPRYYLVGGEIMSGDDAIGTGTSSGMPGWDNYNVPFIVITNTPIHATCSLTLTSSNPTANYLIEVRDRVDGLSYGKSAHLGDGDTITFDTRDVKVTFQANAGTAYTFAITGVDANDRPKVSVERPHQVNFGRKYINIGGSLTDGDDGGTVAVTKDADASNVSNGAWLPYGTAVTYTASPISGYKVDWYSSDDYDTGYITSSYTFKHAGKSTGNGYVKFTELATKVTLSNDGHGHIEIGGETAENTTCGVTTTRSLTAVPNTGYAFSSWTKVSGDDITISPTNETTTTLTGKGSGLTTGQEVHANFTAKTYNITLNDDQEGEHNGSATISYDATSLTVTSHAIIDGWMRLGYWNSAGNKVSDADGKLEANVPDYTNSSKEWNHDGDVTLWAHWYRIVTLDKNGGSGDGTIGVDYKGYSSSLSRPTRSGYSVEGFYAEAGCTTKVMNPDGTLVKNVSGYTDSNGKWIHKTADKLYTKWIFIIYRTGDKADDPRAQNTDVESYAGGTISEEIEYRMKVRELDKWYTLCLPFTVKAVKVWDEEDCAYYDLVPYYRTEVGAMLQGGHYIIRTPNTATNLAITEFGDWRDPTSPTGYKPSANTPYIIQWHMSYFDGKYVSFFGAADQYIHSSMSAGTAPTASNVVNVCVNNSMTTGSVAGAYMLEPDYGSDGAWLRLEDASAPRTVLPFECYVLANTETTGRYLVIRRDMTITETPTGFDTMIPKMQQTNKVIINGQLFIIRDNKMYNIYGKEVQQ